MCDYSLPSEILEIIIEDVILEHEKTWPKRSAYIKGKINLEDSKFIPRWYILPLLRVSKRWYAMCAKYLYKSIAVGSDAPFEKTTGCDEDRLGTNSRPRKGREVANDLCRTLATNSRLAAFVKQLQLGIDPLYHSHSHLDRNIQHDPEWTQTNIHILQLCPNVEHVEVCGFEHSELDTLVTALKKKSLVSFRISNQYLSVLKRRKGGQNSQILDMMQNWPKLRSIWADRFRRDEPGEDAMMLDAPQVSSCCPDLREITLTGATLQASQYRVLHAMCSGGISKLAISLYRFGSSGDAAVDALCECLRTWSPTLEYLKIDIQNCFDPYGPLHETIATLANLRELHVTKMNLDLGFISKLPRLERFSCLFRHSAEGIQDLSSHLKESENFPSLNYILLRFETADESIDALRNICRKRKIQLE